MTRLRAAGAGALALAVLVACREPERSVDGPAAERQPEQGAGARPEGAPAPQSPVAATDTAWTVGTLSTASTVVDAVATLTGVRAGAHQGYERVALELGGAGSGFPGYTVSYVDRPLHACGSGDQIQPVGQAWLEVRMEPLDAHTAEGQPTVPHTPQDLAGGLDNLLRVYLTCDFEAVVTLVLAMNEPNRFRVLTLEQPRRIVVDVER